VTLKARVRAGRLVFDEPTDLPEGTEVELLPLDPGDWLDEASRTALHQALQESELDVAAGRLIDAEEILAELRST
jgi:hypothetical protein